MIDSGHAVIIGSDVDTDMIIAGRYLRTTDKKVWVDHIFEDYDSTLAQRLNGAVLIAGKNIGCGSSREQAAAALKEAGVKAVIAPSFARIFFRNCINIGLQVFEISPNEPALSKCKDGDNVAFDTEMSTIIAGGDTMTAKELSPRMKDILSSGGLGHYLKGVK